MANPGTAIHKLRYAATHFVTKDLNLRIKADVIGIPSEDFYKDKIQYTSLYSGIGTININAAQNVEYIFSNSQETKGMGFGLPGLGRGGKDCDEERSKSIKIVEYLLDRGILEMEPLTYIRGRRISISSLSAMKLKT